MEEKRDIFKVGGKGTAKGTLKLLMVRKQPIPPGAYTQEEFDTLIAEEEV